MSGYSEDAWGQFGGDSGGEGVGCPSCSRDVWFCYDEGGEEYFVCNFCGWRIRSKDLSTRLYERIHAAISEEEGPFDTTRTMIDKEGNTWVWDWEREIYVNCGVQK